MIDARSAASRGTEPQDVDVELIGARLEVARLRKYPDVSIAKMARDLTSQYEISKSAYYGHERGKSRIRVSALHVYAAFFDIPVGYLLHGEGAERFEAEARAVAQAKRLTLRIDFLGSADPALSKSVNQPLRNGKFHLPSEGHIRFIVKLMATDLKKIAEGKATIADISGEKLPIPPGLDLSADVGWWQIPDYDHSMTGPGEAAFPPGTLCLLDLNAPIEPGKFVVALLASQAEPVVRQYVSDRRWAHGGRFKLDALNPNSEAIRVDDPSDCLLIARICFSGSPR